MSFVALFKQIPDLAHVRIDPATKRLVREGVPNVMNPFDMHAIEAALQLRDRLGGRAVAVTMGPPFFKQSADEALAMGVDEVVHLSDRAFAGADTLATSRALAAAVRRFAPDFVAVFAGKYSWDGDTGHVGPQVAEMLGIPHVSGVVRLEVEGGRAVAEREVEDGVEEVEVPLPALFTVTDRTNTPRNPGKPSGSYRVVSAGELGVDPSLLGQAGSATVVEDLLEEEIPKEAGGRRVDARKDPELGARALLNWLREVLAEREAGEARPAPLRRGGGGVIAVVAEDGWRGGIRRVSFELLAKAVELAEEAGGLEVVAIYGGAHDPRELVWRGADRVMWVRGADPFDIYAHGRALEEFIKRERPWAVLAPSTAYGRDLMARTAARLGLGLTADCVNFSTRDGRLLQFKPAYGGSVISIITSRTSPQMATARPGMFTPFDPNPAREGRVEEVRLEPRYRPMARRPVELGFPDPQEASVVVGVGMGFKRAENLTPALELARLLGAAVAATRPVVLRGWLPYQLQVGVSGKAIAARAYLALGIRGDMNHLAGIRRVRRIAAVNLSPHAEIFRVAELGVIGDVNKVVPLLLEMAKAEGLRISESTL